MNRADSLSKTRPFVIRARNVDDVRAAIRRHLPDDEARVAIIASVIWNRMSMRHQVHVCIGEVRLEFEIKKNMESLE